MLIKVKQYGHALQYASEALSADEEIVSAAIQQGGWGVLNYAPEKFRQDREVILADAKNWRSAENHDLILSNIQTIINEDIDFCLKLLQAAPGLIRKVAIPKENLSEIVEILYKATYKRKTIHLIWLGSLPESYHENLEHIVQNNFNDKIILWVNDSRQNHTLSVINKSIISDQLINKIEIKSFDKLVREMPFTLENVVEADNKEILFKASDLYRKYCYGIYHN